MAETLIKTFIQISKADTKIAGGKGSSLGEMTQAGIPVPEGFVILSNAFDRFLEKTDLNVEIDAVLDEVDIKEVAKNLKSKFACGGTVKGNAIELQGTHGAKVKTELIKLGFDPSLIELK